ncbi:hypothetical protein EUGRSUZ_C02567 [Eucalyptus grandis]|uniref:Uncharacterized protein n=1 Tax=Eucalyptus grandis TaxID=71139 RepID=A0ACC3LG14_EUCGR|nr:hypothetical protein EUGRSUZ_C02567 [Eucalyptus grandis]
MKRKDSSHGKAVVITNGGDVELSLGTEFEVFLNFRGPDTRLNFTDCLYHAMDGAGTHVFKDNEEIRKGEVIKGELEHAIKNSTIFMPIFSKNYASSAWCLRELTFRVDCSRNRDDKAMILPIFFDVDHDDVKLKTRLFHNALQKHEQKFGGNLVQQWKEALTEAAHIKGWDLKDTGQGELIRSIVGEVLIKLNNRDKNLPDYLVGIQNRVKDVMRMSDEASLDVHYVVIHDMGGIGKTTLAKVVFNQISGQFNGFSFLSGVREAAKDGKIVQLQMQLLSEILKSKPMEIFEADTGINQIKWRFRHKKVLIVLDDLDEWNQLSKLAAKSDWFGVGSRIIITTRDTNNLAIKEYKVYQMTELPYYHAFQLFSKHAFRMDSPPHDYNDISCNITRMTGGLPLALEVIGCSLYRKRKSIWKEMLKKLELVPEQHIYDKLKISVEMLKEEHREIFLDIACYHIGGERIYPYYMWKALDIYPKIEIDFLIGMSLIKIDDDDRLLMHGLLRDLGREIGTENIIALKLRGLSKDYNFTSDEFSRLPSLRLLELEGGNLAGDFKNLLSNLKWLSWCRCPSNLQAVNLCLQNLVVLKISNSEIPENWNGWVIRLMRCYLSTTPDFSTCLKLRILIFAQHCPKTPQISSSIGKLERLKRLEIIACMRELHPSIGEMVSLTFLSLEDCYQLKKLPNSIGKLRSLLKLNLFNTRIRELPDSIGNLKMLTEIDLGHTKIITLPTSIGDLKSLELLDLGQSQIRELPNSIGGLESLLDLDLSNTKIIVLPASIGCLKRLKRLDMYLSNIRVLPSSIGNLKSLEEMDLGRTQITVLPSSIGGLESLLFLNLGGTRLPKFEIRDLGEMELLKKLNIKKCSSIERLPKLSKLYKLKTLCISDCRSLQCLPDLPNSMESSPELLISSLLRLMKFSMIANSVRKPTPADVPRRRTIWG